MSTSSLTALARFLGAALAPLATALTDEGTFRRLMWRTGWDVGSLPAGYAALAGAVTDAVDAAAALADDADPLDVLAAIDAAGAVYRALTPLPAAPDGVDEAEFLAEAGGRLFEYLLADELRRSAPVWYRLAEAIGVVGVTTAPPGSGHSPVPRTTFDWAALPEALSDPRARLVALLRWGTDLVDFSALSRVVANAAVGAGLVASLDLVGAGYSDAVQAGAGGTPAGPIQSGLSVYLAGVDTATGPHTLTVSVTELPAEGTELPGVVIRPVLPGADEVALTDRWSVAPAAGADLTDEPAVLWRPGGVSVRYPFASGRPATGTGLVLTYRADPPALLFGDPAGSRLELAGAALSGHLDVVDGVAGVRVEIALDGLAIVVSPAGADQFLGALLDGVTLRADVPFSLSWSSRSGLSAGAGLGVRVSLTPDLDLGVFRVDRVDLGLDLATGSPGTLTVFAAAAFSGALGPFQYAVDGLGAELVALFADGNAGPFDLRAGVRWPTGLGLGIDTGGIVTGGGFLSLDPAAGRYAGIAELTMLSVGLTAAGIVETTLPGSPGWSLFLSVIADFTPVPLGFGFTLNGVGGFIGFNRGIDPDALSLGVREGRIDSVLFPTDPIADATRILADIEEFFPNRDGGSVFGAMVKIGWGSPTLLTAEVGVALTVPDLVIVVLGELAATLPVPQAPVIDLHMGVVGVIDVPAGTLSVTASLYGSSLLGQPLAGDMAMYLTVGGQPYFLLSVGGYSPGWQPPGAVPSAMRDLARMSVAVDLGADFDVGLDAYLAVTANTVQFGGSAHATLSVRVFAVDFTATGRFDYDVQITFDPFAFVARMSAGVVIAAEGRTLLGVTLRLVLEGPTDWYGSGSAEFTFLGMDVPFEIELGAPPADERATTIDLWAQVLQPALAAPAAWSATGTGSTDVTLRALDPVAEDGLWLAADAAVEVRQRMLPLDRVIDVYGHLTPVGADRFDIADAGLSTGTGGDWEVTQEWYAPAQYTAMSDAQRMAAPSYEYLDAGVRVSPPGVAVPGGGDVVAVAVGYEEKILTDDADAPWVAKALGDRVVPTAPPAWPRTGGPAGRYTVGYAGLLTPLSVAPTRYTLVDAVDAGLLADPPPVPGPAVGGGYAFADAVRAPRPATVHLRVVPVSARRGDGGAR